jgi:hypothetical protein
MGAWAKPLSNHPQPAVSFLDSTILLTCGLGCGGPVGEKIHSTRRFVGKPEAILKRRCRKFRSRANHGFRSDQARVPPAYLT